MSLFFSSRRRHTRWPRDWSSDVCSSDLGAEAEGYTIVVTNPSLDVTQRLNLTLTTSGIRVGQPTATVAARPGRSEERRVGKERRGRGAARRGQEESGRVGRTGARGRTTS